MYTLTTGVSPENSGVVSRDPHATTYQNGTEVTLTANPAAGYRFAGWSDESLDQVTPITISMTRNINITANFVPISTPEGYTLIVRRDPELGGTVTLSPSQSHYPSGTEVTVTATAEPGYAFDGWSGALDTAVRIITVIMDEDKELTAHFLLAPHKLTTSATAGGRVTVDPDYDSYAHNARVTATAHAEPGYVFVRWTGASALSSNPVTITMNADRELNAIFELIGDNHYTLTIHTNPTDGRGGRVEREPENEAYAFGSDVVLRAIPESGYRFMGWSGGLESEKAEDTVKILGPTTVTAQFQQVRTLTIEREPEEGGSVTPESGLSYAIHGIDNPIVEITATPAEGYRLASWTRIDGTATIASTGSAATTITLSSDATIRANFRPFVLQVGASNGTVSRTDITPWVIDITATPTPLSVFVNWTVISGTVTLVDSTSANTTVTLGSDAAIRANFHIPVFNPNINYGSLTDSRDGTSYRTVVIGTQTWMAENLNFNAPGSVCYNNEPSNCDIYGRLYDWSTAMAIDTSYNRSSYMVSANHKGVCPVGWHVPSDDELRALETAVGGSGTALKAGNGWGDGWDNSGNGTNRFGFSALPGGSSTGSRFFEVGHSGFWWSATELDGGNAWSRRIYAGQHIGIVGVSRYIIGKSSRYSLRCLEDD